MNWVSERPEIKQLAHDILSCKCEDDLQATLPALAYVFRFDHCTLNVIAEGKGRKYSRKSITTSINVMARTVATKNLDNVGPKTFYDSALQMALIHARPRKINLDVHTDSPFPRAHYIGPSFINNFVRDSGGGLILVNISSLTINDVPAVLSPEAIGDLRCLSENMARKFSEIFGA